MFNLKGTSALINKLLFILACPFAEMSKRNIPVKMEFGGMGHTTSRGPWEYESLLKFHTHLN